LKTFNKKGFSLLEVMLAVAIMAIVSSMIMYGFMSSMNYANNSSIYARVGAVNTGRGYNQVVNGGTQGQRANYAQVLTNSNNNGGSLHSISVTGDYTGNFQMRTFRYTTYDTAHSDLDDTFNVTSNAVTDALEGTGSYSDATVSDNRTSFFYTIPDANWPSGYSTPNAKCPVCGTEYTLEMHRRGGEGYTGHYHWVCPNINDPSHDSYRAAVLAAW
jgi:prepilin-type N-terminal cleavage/methylation domain-containing protein